MAQLRLFFLGTILLALAYSCAHHQTQQDQPSSSEYSSIDHESTQRAPLETLRARAMKNMFVLKLSGRERKKTAQARRTPLCHV